MTRTYFNSFKALPTETGESPSESDNVIKIEKDPDLDEHRKEALKFFINDNPENYLTSCSEGAKKILMNSIDILENPLQISHLHL